MQNSISSTSTTSTNFFPGSMEMSRDSSSDSIPAVRYAVRCMGGCLCLGGTAAAISSLYVPLSAVCGKALMYSGIAVGMLGGATATYPGRRTEES